ncbi:MAG: Rha family transcriptional regulator [Microscillaceae bacterium]|nr:Rha family transcriptional regulator [Microscillaceae bacterium]
MNELVIIQRKEALTTSLKVAEAFEKRHDHVIRDIETLIVELGSIESSLGALPKFGESSYFNAQNKKQKMYKLNRQAFTLLAMGYTGAKALQFKLAYMNAFDEMERKIKEILESTSYQDLLEKKRQKYKKQGYSDAWIEERLDTIEVRNELESEWRKRGVTEAKEFAQLSATISKETFGITPKEHKKIKSLKNHNLRDHMTRTELAFAKLGEVATIDIAQVQDAQGFEENQDAAQKGGKIAGEARKLLEAHTQKPVVTSLNFLPENKIKNLKK